MPNQNDTERLLGTIDETFRMHCGADAARRVVQQCRENMLASKQLLEQARSLNVMLDEWKQLNGISEKNVRDGFARQLLSDNKTVFVAINNDAPKHNCRFCGARSELWEINDQVGNALKSVMCTNSGEDDEGNSSKETGDPCAFYLPPPSYYRATQRAAIEHWNRMHAPKIEGARAAFDLYFKNGGYQYGESQMQHAFGWFESGWLQHAGVPQKTPKK